MFSSLTTPYFSEVIDFLIWIHSYDKNIFVYKFFLLLNASDFSLFFMQKF